jgi:tetratricopeptide (TPR) repeat protein
MFRALLILALVNTALYGQSLPEKVSARSCACMAEVKSVDSLELKFKDCVGPAMAAVIMEDKDQEFEYTVENIQRNSAMAFELLPSVCPLIRKLVVAHKAKMFYAASLSEAANEFYERGSARMTVSDFEGAVLEFKKAIKVDKSFVMAIDNLGACYRSLNQLKDAVSQFKRSLDIFPEGLFALINIAEAYLLQNDAVKARNYYDRIILLYPEKPEGYFGVSRSLLLKEKYEEALGPVCQAHVIYSTLKSDSLPESENTIEIIYAKLKSEGKEKVFRETILRYGIHFNEQEN